MQGCTELTANLQYEIVLEPATKTDLQISPTLVYTRYREAVQILLLHHNELTSEALEFAINEM